MGDIPAGVPLFNTENGKNGDVIRPHRLIYISAFNRILEHELISVYNFKLKMFRPKINFYQPADIHLMKQAKNENNSVADQEPDKNLHCHTPLIVPGANTKTI